MAAQLPGSASGASWPIVHAIRYMRPVSAHLLARPTLLEAPDTGQVALPPSAFLTALCDIPAWLSCCAILQISFGPISWLLVGEIFPLAVRGQAAAVATLTNFSSNWLVSLALPSLQTGIGLGKTYALFAAIGVVALISIYNTVPETRGKSLEEIEAMFAESKGE